ncbi:MAG TPA: hypothetical protein VNL16_07045 [Chloroflexota bacterium]|nr:hypothetical protein [Chloroflexota bacterium]
MQFLVTITVLDTIALDADKRLREVLGPQLQSVMESGKVRASGLLANKRGGFFLLEISAPEELYELLGPEIYGSCQVSAEPVAPIQKAGELFQKWAAAGR